MSQTAYILLGISYYVVSVIIIVIVLNLINKREKKKYQSEIIALERDKNLIISSSILSELNKVEALVNNEKMQETFEDWQERFKEIKDVEVPKITDALIEIEDYLGQNVDYVRGTLQAQGLKVLVEYFENFAAAYGQNNEFYRVVTFSNPLPVNTIITMLDLSEEYLWKNKCSDSDKGNGSFCTARLIENKYKMDY